MAELAPDVRLFYIGLWCVADDAGWIEWNTATIGADLFPYSPRQEREAAITSWAQALEGSRRIVRHGCGCVSIPTLPTHQRIGGNKSTTAYDRHIVHTGTDTSEPIRTDTHSPAPARANNATSTNTHTVTGGAGGNGLPHLDSAVAATWEQATGRTVLASGNYAAEYLDDACRRHSITDVCVAVLKARKTFDHIPDAAQLVSAMRPILDPLPDRNAVVKAEDTTKRSAAAKRELLLTKHSGGYHIDAADPDCPKCQKGAA